MDGKFAIVLVLFALCFGSSSVAARKINITMLDNCQDLEVTPEVTVENIQYHMDEDDLCDMVHSSLKIRSVDKEPLQLTVTLFKCEEANMKTICLDNPTVHEEFLTCDRLKNDDSGPWHMFTSKMPPDYQCGKKAGEIPIDFARFRIEYLMKYLDIYDAQYNTFRLKMNFMSTALGTVRGCGELDFVLLAI